MLYCSFQNSFVHCSLFRRTAAIKVKMFERIELSRHSDFIARFASPFFIMIFLRRVLAASSVYSTLKVYDLIALEIIFAYRIPFDIHACRARIVAGRFSYRARFHVYFLPFSWRTIANRWWLFFRRKLKRTFKPWTQTTIKNAIYI